MMPGSSRNWRRTSSTTSPPTRPTAVIASAAKRNGIMPPMKSPATTYGLSSENTVLMPASTRPRVYSSNRISAARPAEPIA